MKAILEFTLPDEAFEHLAAVRATTLIAVIADYDQQLRKWLKHDHPFTTPEEALETAREALWGAIREEDLTGLLER